MHLHFKSPALLLLLALSLGCASTPSPYGWLDTLARDVSASGLDPEAVIAPLALTEEIRTWAREAVEGHNQEEQKVRALLSRLVDPNEFRLTYGWGYTGTATEVFEQKQANCLRRATQDNQA